MEAMDLFERYLEAVRKLLPWRRQDDIIAELRAKVEPLLIRRTKKDVAKDLPPKSTVHDYFLLLDRSGALARMHEALYVATREREGRPASPTAAIIDSQSAKAAQKGALGWTRRAMTRPRKSRAASATCSSIRSVCS